MLSVGVTGCASSELTSPSPREGTVVYRSVPQRTRTIAGTRTLRATTLVFTTVGHELEQDSNYEVAVSERLTPGQIARGVMSSASRPVTSVIDGDLFSELWSQLKTAGLFELPRYRAGSPPTDVSYISVQGANQRFIFRKPATVQGFGSKDDPEFKNMTFWRDSTFVVATFLNAR